MQGANNGNTSGYEDGTEGEEGPIKKRAKVTQVDTVNNNPFGSEPDSLRVAASTSGSLRNIRPRIAAEGAPGNHLQEVPRAPTPVPQGPFRVGGAQKKRPRESAMSKEVSQTSPPAQITGPLSPSQQDGRSPESIIGDTPVYSGDSPAEIGSSPPVPRTTSFMRSSPPPSSPILPPMPVDQAPPTDALEDEAMTDLFGEDASQMAQIAATVKPAFVPHSGVRQSRKGLPRPADMRTPMQVWRMEDCPDGTQDLVHVHSYNQPDPTEHAKTQFRTLRPLRVAGSQQGQPAMVPTPPPTTDATEKPTSPPQSDPPQSQNGPPESGPHPFEKPAGPSAPNPASPSAEEQQDTPRPASQAELPGLAPSSCFAPSPQAGLAVVRQLESTVQVQEQSRPDEPSAVPSVETQAPELPAPVATKKAPAKPRVRAKAPPRSRKLARSQSAGNLAVVPASEPAGPSGLSQSVTVECGPPVLEAPVNLRRAQSTGPLNVPVPASDPVGPSSGLAFPQLALPEPVQPTIEPLGDALPEPSSPGESKNVVKRNAIKQRLEAAIKRGEMPPYCANCGAIETPTWRKIYCQEHDGSAPIMSKEQMGNKPGDVTIVQTLQLPTDDTIGRYQIAKKALGDDEVVDEWTERILCNPCGIWLSKNHQWRPQEMWRADADRLGKTRKRKPSESAPSKAKKRSRSKSTTQPEPTSEAPVLPTDGPAPTEATSHEDEGAATIPETTNASFAPLGVINNEDGPVAESQQPASTHSRGTGSAKSPIELELDAAMGSTKRLLFPSPRKDSSPKALSDLDVNIAQTGDFRLRKEDATPTAMDKGTLALPEGSVRKHSADKVDDDDLEDLFRSPLPPRPTTPISVTKAGPPTTPFKTPTRATPSHRPITRSVSRSLRSKGSVLDSPSAAFRRTPSQTPSKASRDEYVLPGSATRRLSPGHQIMVDIDERLFDTPMSRAMNQLLSEPNFGIEDDDIVDLVPHAPTDWEAFNIFSTDAPLPSSPPRVDRFEGTWSGQQQKDWGDFLEEMRADSVANEQRN